MSRKTLHFWKITLALSAVLLAALPAPARASCLLQSAGRAPRPLAEPCDPVLLSHAGVSVNVTVFDIALSVWIPALPAHAGHIWQILSAHHFQPRASAPAPDSPPPRSALIDPRFVVSI